VSDTESPAPIFDPSEEPTRIDPLHLNAMAAKVTAQAGVEKRWSDWVDV
jgi:hypothetical protein